MNRGKLARIFLGVFSFIAGIGLGLGLSWGLFPTRLDNTAPDTFSPTDKDLYRILVADDFRVNNDLARARTRLSLLNEPSEETSLSEQIAREKLQGDPLMKLDALQALGNALLKYEESIKSPGTFTQSSNDFIPLPQPSPKTGLVASPGATGQIILTLTPGVSRVYNRKPVCTEGQEFPSAQIFVLDKTGQPVNGVVLVVRSDKLVQRLVTGLDPEIGPGYADFILEPGLIYTLTLESESEISERIGSSECTGQDGRQFLGGWLIEIHL